VTLSAQGFEQGLSVLLLAIESVSGLTAGAYRQQSEARLLHGGLDAAGKFVAPIGTRSL
jgi:hypothetical protein